MDSQAALVFRMTATIDGAERCVVWRKRRLVGDAAWIEAAERIDPQLTDRAPLRVVHVLEEAAGVPVRLLVADEQANHAFAEDGVG